jgi:hypothetical protein
MNTSSIIRTTIAFLAACGFAAADTAKPDAKPPSGDVAAWVDQRVEQWQPAAEEKRFDEIGWCTELVEAERLARENKRPIFFFTHDGRMGVGRC